VLLLMLLLLLQLLLLLAVGCCHVRMHALSFSHCPSGAQGGGPLTLCYGSLFIIDC
jgi:hypothetical protein